MRWVAVVLMWGLAVAQPVEAASHYVRAGAGGANTGTDWTDALTNLPTTFIRGDTYFVATGTYTRAVSGNAAWDLTDAESGTTVITIRAATIAAHGTDTGWSDTFQGQATFTTSSSGGQIFRFGTGYWLMDGVYGCSPTSTCGFRIDRSNATVLGCSGGAQGFQMGLHNNTMQYVEVKGTGNTTTPDSAGIFDIGFRLSLSTNNTLSHLYVHDQGGGWGLLDSTTGTTIEYSYFRNNRSTATCHSEGFAIRSVFGGPPATGTTNMILRYNVFENADGTGYLATPVNGPANTLPSSNWYIYGNVFAYNAGDSNGQASAAGAMQIFSIAITGDFFFYNNTISSLDRNSGLCGIVLAGGQTIAALTVQNNLWYNCAGQINAASGGVTTLVWTYNAYFDTPTSDADANKQVAAGNPFVNVSQLAGGTNFHLASATTAGVTLPSPYNTDPDGVTRGTDGSWDRGAYEIGGGAPSVPSPPVPGPPAPGGKAPTRRRR